MAGNVWPGRSSRWNPQTLEQRIRNGVEVMPMVGCDLETTGVDIETAHIVTACVGIAGQAGWTPRNWLLTQPEPIPEAATAVHGISTEYANEHGQQPEVALPQIRDDLYKAWESGMPVVGFNLGSYDLTLLDRSLRRYGLGGLDIRGPVLDVSVLDKHVDRFRRGPRKLIDVAAHYGVPLNEADAHGAEADALASCRIAWKLGAHPKLNRLSLTDLHTLQVDAYREQRESFAAYRARKGEPLDDVNTHWPLRPAA